MDDIRAPLANQKYVRNTKAQPFLLLATENTIDYCRLVEMHAHVPHASAAEREVRKLRMPMLKSSLRWQDWYSVERPRYHPLDHMDALVERGNTTIDTSQIFTRGV